MLRLIACYLRAGVEVDGDIQPSERGVPQGGPLSPLLANIVLDDFDKLLEQRGHRFARYADDFVVLVKSRKAGERVMAGISEVYRIWPELDTWLRRRVRLCFWVMWRRPYPRIKRLLKLGVSVKQAVGLGRSSLGPWKCSRLLGFAMSPKWLEEQGLINLADDWWRCAHLR